MPTLLNKEIGPIGYGLMGLTWRSPARPSQPEAINLLNTAFECGANFWNAGELYGTPERNSMHLLNEYFTAYPEKASKVLLSMKGGMDPTTMKPDSTEAGLKRSVDTCLRVLDGKKSIDIFECARVDPNVSIEDTIRVLGQFVKEGKIGGIGLSEVKAETIRRAHKIHPIAVVEVELSLWTPDVLHNDIATTCAELGIPIVAYAPLSRGALTGDFATKNSDLPEFRRAYPKFQDEVLQSNLRLSQEVEKVAKRKGCTSAQVALGWIVGLNGWNGFGLLIPIPGAEKKEWVQQNSQHVTLTKEEMQQLEVILKEKRTSGDRYWAAFAEYCEEK
jgi:pyridoxine 4-dehydrogenase